MERGYDVLVVGAGILGTFHAYHCLQQGLSVALLEKNTQPKGATVRNFGQIVPSGMDIKWQRLGRRSLEIYKQIQDEVDITVRQYGTVYIASNADELTLINELAQINIAEQYNSQLLSPKDCIARWPGLKKSYCKGGLFFPEEIVVNPRALVHRIIEHCTQKYGLDYYPNCTVMNVKKLNNNCIITDHCKRDYLAESVFICSGTEARLLFPEVLEKSNIEAVKLQMLQTVPQPNQRIKGSILTGRSIRRYESFQSCPSYKEIKAKEDANSYARRYGVHILFKQAEDGSVIIGDSHEYQPIGQQDSLGFELQNEINEFILSEAQQIFDLQDWTIAQSWSGQYAQMIEGDIFQKTIDKSIHIVTGIGGKGMTASAGFAEQHVQKVFS